MLKKPRTRWEQAKELFQLKGSFQSQSGALERPATPWFWRISTFGTLPLPKIGNTANRLWFPEQGRGKATVKCWLPARCTLMVLSRDPVQAVGWDTEQEIEAEVWLEKRAAVVIRYQSCNGKLNSSLFTVLLIPAPLGPEWHKGEHGGFHNRMGKAGIVRDDSAKAFCWHPLVLICLPHLVLGLLC